jgi:hypothetical protein
MVIIYLPCSFITLFESHNAADNLWRSKLPIASPEGHAALDRKAPYHRLVTLEEHLNHALKYLQPLILLAYHFFPELGERLNPISSETWVLVSISFCLCLQLFSHMYCEYAAW